MGPPASTAAAAAAATGVPAPVAKPAASSSPAAPSSAVVNDIYDGGAEDSDYDVEEDACVHPDVKCITKVVAVSGRMSWKTLWERLPVMRSFVPRGYLDGEYYVQTKKISAYVWGPMSSRAAAELTALADGLRIFKGKSQFRVRVFDFDESWDAADDNFALNALLRISGFGDAQIVRRSPRQQPAPPAASAVASAGGAALPGPAAAKPAPARSDVLATARGSNSSSALVSGSKGSGKRLRDELESCE